MSTRIFLAVVAIALAAAIGGATWFYSAERAGSAPAVVRNQEALVRPHAPTLGNVQAPVHIVEFLDPACETCAAFYPLVKQVMARHPDRIRLTIRYAPFHRGSADVVRILEASRLQGRYWETLETLLRRQADWTRNHTAHPELALQAVSGTGLDLQRLQADMRSPQIDRILAQDEQDARVLEVEKTPEYFVNGRPLPEFGMEPLVALIEQELRRTAAAASR